MHREACGTELLRYRLIQDITMSKTVKEYVTYWCSSISDWTD